jgi:pSer/pThr/pTyr-binding forkhead associated (FHA) protein
MAYLIIREVDKEPVRHQLKGATTVGRAWDCDISLSDRALSRRHCCVEPVDSEQTEWTVVDLQSRNGTRMNGKRILRRPLVDGEILQIGRASLQFHAAGFVAQRPELPSESTPPAASDAEPPNVAVQRSDPTSRALPSVINPGQSVKPPAVSGFRKKPDTTGTVPFQRDPAQPLVHERTVDLEMAPPRRSRKTAMLIGAAIAAGMLAWMGWMLLR